MSPNPQHPPQEQPELRPDAGGDSDPSGGRLEFSFKRKARSVVFDRAREVAQFRNCHSLGWFLNFRTNPEATFGLDEILAVYQGSQKDGVKYLRVITSSGVAWVFDKDSSGASFEELARALCALAPNDLRAPAETHPIVPLVYVAGGISGLCLFVGLLVQDRVSLWFRSLPDSPGWRLAVGLGCIAGAVGSIVLGVASVYWLIRLAHRRFGIKLGLALGLGFLGAFAGVILGFLVVSAVGGFLAGLSAGLVLERRKSSLAEPPKPASPPSSETLG